MLFTPCVGRERFTFLVLIYQDPQPSCLQGLVDYSTEFLLGTCRGGGFPLACACMHVHTLTPPPCFCHNQNKMSPWVTPCYVPFRAAGSTRYLQTFGHTKDDGSKISIPM